MKSFIKKHPGLCAWLSFWVYGICAAVFVEFILLPYLIPQIHAGEGFIRENPDSRTYHAIACALVRHFNEVGWRFWELRPIYSSPAAIASVFYHLFGQKLGVLIPYQSLVHATSAFLIFKIFGLCGFRSKLSAYLGALPFLIFPGSFLMLTQLQKDGVYILGTLGVLFSVLGIVQENQKYKHALGASIVWLMGAFLIWWFRSDRLIVPILASCAVLFPFLIFYISKGIRSRKGVDFQSASLIAVFFVTICAGVVFFSKSYHKPYITNRNGIFKDSRFVEAKTTSSVLSAHADEEDDDDEDHPNQSIWGRGNWQYSHLLPRSVEDRIVDVVATRMSFFRLHPKSNSFVDKDVFIYSLKDFIFYQPRNLQVAYFAPFPSFLLNGGIFQKLVLGEMIVYYGCFCLLLLGLFFLKTNKTFWALIFVHVLYSSIYAFAIPNMGAFHRQRYLLFTLIIGLAVAFIAELILRVKNGEKLRK